jgi:ABC-type branched-subunit amino acid transport system permease subunit
VVFFLLLTEGLRFLGEYRMVIYGISVVLMMNVRPHGLIDDAVVHRVKRLVWPGADSRGERRDARS